MEFDLEAFDNSNSILITRIQQECKKQRIEGRARVDWEESKNSLLIGSTLLPPAAESIDPLLTFYAGALLVMANINPYTTYLHAKKTLPKLQKETQEHFFLQQEFVEYHLKHYKEKIHSELEYLTPSIDPHPLTLMHNHFLLTYHYAKEQKHTRQALEDEDFFCSYAFAKKQEQNKAYVRNEELCETEELAKVLELI